MVASNIPAPLPATGGLEYSIVLPPQGEWSTDMAEDPSIDGEGPAEHARKGQAAGAASIPAARQETWKERVPTAEVAHHGVGLALLNPLQWDEPSGMVMIEAMIAGTPVLSTSRGAALEIVVDGVTGFLRDTPRALADAQPECANLSRANCRRSTETTFSVRRMVGKHMEFYEECLARKHGPRPVRE